MMKNMLLALMASMFSGSTLVEVCAGEVMKYNGVPGTPRPQIYAHRAGRGLMPEQTMPAYEEALRLGVDYVDMDVGMTKDGVLVITHDLTLNPDLTRDADGKWVEKEIPVHSLTCGEIQKYNVGMLKPGTRYASFFPYQRPVDFACIPTLQEVVSFVKQIANDKVGFQIEIKNDPTKPDMTASPKEFAVALHSLLKDNEIIDRTEVQAFDWRCLQELKKLNPDIKTACLSDHTTEKMDDTEKGTWTAGILPKDHDYSLPSMVKHLGGDCWEPYEMDLTKKTLEEARNLGLKVVVWGWPEQEGSEFNYDRVNELFDWGVDGIITDRPDILRGLLAARGYNLPKGFDIQEGRDTRIPSNQP